MAGDARPCMRGVRQENVKADGTIDRTTLRRTTKETETVTNRVTVLASGGTGSSAAVTPALLAAPEVVGHGSGVGGLGQAEHGRSCRQTSRTENQSEEVVVEEGLPGPGA